MKKKIVIEVVALLLTLVLLASVSWYLGNLYMPERLDYGATWNMYLQEPEDTVELMFLGSSLAYCDIIPSVIYEQTGFTTYVVSAPYMKPDTAYYYLKEALKTQSPGVVMLEATSFFFSDQEADYYKVNVGYMPLGLNRLGATLSAPEAERFGLLFPLYNYHDRWTAYSPADYFRPRPDAHPDPLAGYTAMKVHVPQNGRKIREFPATEEEILSNLSWLEKIIALCAEEDIRLELFVVPSCEYLSEDHLARLTDAAGEIPVVDFNAAFEEIGLDFGTDFYDSRHLSVEGAVKFSRYLAEYIGRFDLTGLPHDEELWQQRIDHLKRLLES